MTKCHKVGVYTEQTHAVKLTREIPGSKSNLKLENTILNSLEMYFVCAISECESLVRKMLVRDPAKRYTLKMVRKHVWMQADIKAAEAAKDYSCKPNLQKTPTVINEQILR